MTKNWINLRTFHTAPEAFMAQSLLQEHEIEAMIENQHAANISVAGGVTLVVEAGYAQKALTILDA